jgi:hypothetical protein
MLPQQVRHRHAAPGIFKDSNDLGSLNFDLRMTAPDAGQST